MRPALTCIIIAILLLVCPTIQAQELSARVELNTQRVEGTKTSVYDNLKESITRFLNERHWTNQQYAPNERIKCSFTINISKFNEESGQFTCEAFVQSQRPVYNSSYTTTMLNIRDRNFSFEFHEFDQLEFRDDQVDNSLTALLAYYAYLIIGVDMDGMAELGGTEILQKALAVANNSQNFSVKGWKAFDDYRNRFGIINDYLDGAVEPFRKMQYTYHRLGLDEMTTNTDRARAAITEAMGQLKEARDNKSLCAWPQFFSEYKRDELVGIYNGKGTSANKQEIYDLLVKVNASQSAYWKKLLE